MAITSTDHAWTTMRAELRAAVGAEMFDIWLAPLRLEAVDGNRLTLTAPASTCSWVADRFGSVLERTATRTLGEPVEVVVVPAGQETPGTGRWRTDKQEGAAATLPSREPNPKLTFEQFVIGPENRFAHGAALSVAENPGITYNPLFICGPPGVGKTHLLHSIAAYARQHGGGRILLTNAEDFASSFVEAVRRRRMDRFKAHHRQVDMILVDDVQFLMDKARTEEEFFHTFNALSEGGAQIVLACDRPPLQLDRLEERLRDRLGSGLVAPIARPDQQTRVAALRKRALTDGLEIEDEEVIATLARQEQAGNLRSLEAALVRAVAYSSLSGRRLDSELATTILHELGGPDASRAGRDSPLEVEQVISLTAAHFDLSSDELAGPGRSAGVAWARQVAMHLCRMHTRTSTTAIGNRFGGRTHSAVLYACRRVEQQMTENPECDREVRLLSAELSTLATNRKGDRIC